MITRSHIYDTYWKTAAERQEIFFKRNNLESPPYTQDPIFQHYKFCNVYRASDRVSQYLISHVIHSQACAPEDYLLRIILFRLINKNETWSSLEKILGPISINNFSFEKYSSAFEQIKKEEGVVYGNAFILCANKHFGYQQKHQNHLALIQSIFKNKRLVQSILQSSSLQSLFTSLRSLPLIGDFMAYQIAIDLNYSPLFSFDENDFTIAGPGAKRGIKKCFINTEGKDSDYVIKYMVDNQEKEFQRLGIKFKNLWGRPLHAIDCQGWFCETDKYCRAKFPDLKSNRVRIKSVYKPSSAPIKYFFPPQWRINQNIINHD